ncbi:MAG: SDR family oxidoreductase [Candidatus Jorgensenbacteria bacterium]|nr:SDR family oxidoreductase [Candidatus Jorgensenbacteria bacterium]
MKNILVTGVSSGMGKAVAQLLVKEGYFVYGIYNTGKEEAEKLKNKLKNIEMFQCDFSNRKNTEALIQKLGKFRFKGIVNSAGVFIDVDLNNFDMKVWEKTFEINLNAPLLLIEGLKENLEKDASIVNISSTDGMIGSFSGMAYSASKAALINITQSLANILAPKKIRTNAIAPGWIGGGMGAPKELLKEVASLNPLKRVGTYEEIAQVVSFLLSDKSSYINGTTITVDGGDMSTNYILRKEAEM